MPSLFQDRRSAQLRLLAFLRHTASRIILPPLLVVLYLWLGWRLFILMLGCAFAGDLLRMSLVVVLLGAGGGYVLSMLPSIVWPRSRFLWPIAYAAITLIFGLGSVGTVTSEKGPWAFVLWSICGLVILAAGLFGAAKGRNISKDGHKVAENPG